MVPNKTFYREMIQEAVDNGYQEAKDFILKNSDDNTKISNEFNKTSDVVTHLIENFDTKKFRKRANDSLPVEELKNMLIGAFKAVTYMNVLNQSLTSPRKLQINHKTLSDAYRTYITRGHDVDFRKASFMRGHIKDVVGPLAHFLRNHSKLAT